MKLRVERLGVPMAESEQMIRATVIGAGQYTLQVSGSTIYISKPELLPHFPDVHHPRARPELPVIPVRLLRFLVVSLKECNPRIQLEVQMLRQPDFIVDTNLFIVESGPFVDTRQHPSQ